MSSHEQTTEEVLRGKLFSPELMVASDLNLKEIKTLYKKFEESKRKRWAEDYLYANPEMKENLKPKLLWPKEDKKEEL